MNPGQPVQYADITGKIVNPPIGCNPDPTKVWIQTPDLMLIAVPNSDKLKVLGQLPACRYSDDEKDLMRASGIPVPVEVKQEPKPFWKTSFIKLPETKKYPAGLYKILAGGLGEDREELKKVVWSLNNKTVNKPFRVVTAEDNSWAVVIEVKS